MTVTVLVFIAYILFLAAIGLVSYMRTKSYSDYNLAGRSNNKWITALSAESSDMSGWLLIGLPGAAYVAGFSSIWILIGLLFGTMLNWILVANRLRVASEAFEAFSITEYFEKRVNDKNGSVSLVAGIAIIIIMIINSSAEIIGSGKLLNDTFGLDYSTGIIIGAAIVMVYTFFGGYLAVSWSNLFEATVMFFALTLVPLVVIVKVGNLGGVIDGLYQASPTFFHFTNGETGLSAVSIILGGLGVGICYFGVVHVLTCFMAIKKSHEIKDSTFIATTWVSITSFGAVIIGMLGAYLFPNIADPEQIFFTMGAEFFPPSVLGIFAAAVMVTIVASASAYIIVAAAAVGANLYRRFTKGSADEKKIVQLERVAVVIIAFCAFLMSLKPDMVFSVALLATAGLGSCFGPLVVFSLYSNLVNRKGAIASIIVALFTVIIWYYSGLSNYIYEAIPGILISTITLLAVSKLTGGPDVETTAVYNGFLKRLKEVAAEAKK